MTIETKYNIGDEVGDRFAGEAILCKIDDALIIENDGFLKVVYSVSDFNGRMSGTRFTNELSPHQRRIIEKFIRV